MNFNLIIFMLFLVYIGCGCTRYKQENVTDLSVLTDSLSLEKRINLSDYGVVGEEDIVFDHGKLYIYQSFDTQNSLAIIDGDKVIRGISIGDGPDEILDIKNIQLNEKHKPYFYDTYKGSINFFNGNDSSIFITSRIIVPRMLDDVVSYKENFIIFPNDRNYSIGLIDKKGELIDSLVYWPPKPDGISSATHALACSGVTSILGDGTFARAILYDGGVDFYKIEDNKIKHLGRYSLFDMQYDALDGGGVNMPAPNEETKDGFMKIKSGQEHFYASFNDSKAMANIDGVSNEIFRFDSMGHLQNRFIIDHYFTDFYVNEIDNEIGVVSTDESGNEYLYIYHLPGVI